MTPQRINSQYYKQYEFEGSCLQSGGLTLLLISLPARIHDRLAESKDKE